VRSQGHLRHNLSSWRVPSWALFPTGGGGISLERPVQIAKGFVVTVLPSRLFGCKKLNIAKHQISLYQVRVLNIWGDLFKEILELALSSLYMSRRDRSRCHKDVF
jgi:hypothetical protein